jgi:predicted kinase
MKELFIVRGLPGSGKSTLAKKLVNEHLHFEADMFYMKDGRYQFDKEQIEQAHKWCQRRVLEAMEDAMYPIAVSNTFVRRWEMDFYYGMAKAFGYQVTEITVTGDYGNIHGVPNETIARMKKYWEV